MEKNKRIISSAAIGGALELFDFASYLFLSPIIAQIFFSKEKGYVAFLATLAAFAAGYLARPIGGILYGHFGDKIGRMRTLAWSIFLMAVPTLLIGLMPTYASIGLMAPTLLVVLRFIQGLAIGGDFPGAICFIGEHTEAQRRGAATVWLIFGINMGAAMGSAVVAGLNALLAPEAMLSYGWRIPFFIGALLAVVGVYIRRRTLETPEFQALCQAGKIQRWPLKALLLSHKREIAAGFAATALAATVTSVLSLFMSSYMLHYVGIPASTALWLNAAAISAFSVICLLLGPAIDRFNPLRVMRAGTFALLLLAYPIYALISTASLPRIVLGLALSAPILAAIMGSLPSVLLRRFPTGVRYSGIGFTYNLGFSIFGGLSPLLVAFLISTTGEKLSPAFFLMGAAALALWPLSLHRADDQKRP